MHRSLVAVAFCTLGFASLSSTQAQNEVPVAPPPDIPPLTHPDQVPPPPPPKQTPTTGVQFDLSTPEATVRSLIAAINRADLKAATGCVLGASSTTPGLAALDQQAKHEKVTFRISELKTIINGNRAMITLQFAVLNAPAQTEPETTTSKIKLQREGNAWKIVPPPVAIVSSYSGPDFLYFITALLRYPNVAQQAAHEVQCQNNVTRLFAAYMRYFAEHQSSPLSANAFKKTLMPYVKDENVFHCPDDASGMVSYRYNPGSARATVTSTNLNAMVLFYEGKNGQLDFRHGGYAQVVTADGDMKHISRQEAKSLIWNTGGKQRKE